MNGLFLNQKTNKNIQISYSLKYKHLKKIKQTVLQDEINIQGSCINQKPKKKRLIL